jgi:hypothetical protein
VLVPTLQHKVKSQDLTLFGHYSAIFGHLAGVKHHEGPDALHIIRAGNANPHPRACNVANMVSQSVAKKYDKGS